MRQSDSSVTIAGTTFDTVRYDAEADMLYLHVGDPSSAIEFDESPEGHHLRFDANGKIWMCGCVVSERPGESSLLIGSLVDTDDYIKQKKQAVFTNWRMGELPSACKPCRVYKAAK